uniref:Uncharacterized protein n=1 Tax=viral metagenome TaxID=1070528 RepID=A0A6C0F3D9_9ZZZZ
MVSHVRRHKRKGNMLKKSYKKISSATKKIIPAVTSGAEAVGSAVTTVGKKTVPVVKSGVSTIWKTLKKGTGMLFSGVNKGLKSLTGKRRGRKAKGTRRKKN